MMNLRKATARLDRRIAAYKSTNKTPEQGFHKPGSVKKSAPKGRGIR